jgi:outer membrane receptor protein involved in Fe transport
MANNLRYLFLLLFLGVGGAAFAQNSGIVGKIVDEKGEAIIGAIVQASEGGTVKGGAQTDENGSYTIKPLNAGRYEVRASYIGYKASITSQVLVSPDKNTAVNLKLEPSTTLNEVVVKEYKVPLIDKYQPGTTQTMTSETIENLPTINTNDAASLAGGTYQKKNGEAVSIGGARSNGTLYIIDGVQVRGTSGTNFPPGTIDQISVITSGVPAKYGDATGGVINITTKGGTSKTQGGVAFEHSIDGYNHNLASFNVTGPLLKKRVDSLNKKNVIGYSIGAQYAYDADPDPNYNPNYIVKADVLDRIRKNPLVATTNSGGAPVYKYASEFITMNDLEKSKKRINADQTNYRFNGKLDYQLAENLSLSVGGNYTNTKAKAYSRFMTLFAPENIPVDQSYTGRGYIRLTQRFGKSNINMEEGKVQKTPLISNAYYTLQADYQVDHFNRENENHKKKTFEYGYIGKFDIFERPEYAYGVDDSTGIFGTRLISYVPTAVTFQRSEINPLLANYTTQYYNLLDGFLPTSLGAIEQGRGLVNGAQLANTYGDLWVNVGSPGNSGVNGYYYTNNEQVAIDVNASFDLQPKKTKHAIEFGLYYQQRTERYYNALGISRIWQTARLLTNKHLNELDSEHPMFLVDGVLYTMEQIRAGEVIPGAGDTILYDTKYNGAEQSEFDKNLRRRLGLAIDDKTLLNIDAMDPSSLSLDLFSPDELINSGNPMVTLYGYDYNGKKLSGQVNFNDWFTKKDADGNYTRQVGAFHPNYIAGYIQDKFEFKDINMNLGVRVERFDANTKVLKDPYSLYAVNTVATSTAVNSINGGKTPDNIGSDYVVYVTDNASSNPQAIGYRHEDDWYDAYGRIVNDPALIKTIAGSSREAQPDLQKNSPDGKRALTMKDDGYDPNSSFTDYQPQVNVMPRLSFTFPIADQSMFYAHYDVLVQRPKTASELYVSPADYYFINQSSNGIIANPNLKPEKLFDYELGFQQVLTQNSSLTITGFYRERKDMIQVRPYINAWPNTYFTFGNRDFSTTKGFTLKYDLRRLGPIQMTLSYTLQFAEGTGSSSGASNGGRSDVVSQAGLLQSLIQAQLPNLRFAFPLDIDSRHNITADIDYRYDEKEGPVVGGTHILENAGINLIFRARSGEPYTKYALPGSSKLIAGSVMGARYPWHYMLDLRVDKDLGLSFGKRSADGLKRKNYLALNAFMYIQNVLNTKDILQVYGYTSRTDDDGFLASPQGQATISTQTDAQSYTELYNLDKVDPTYLNNPRRVILGLSLNF